MKDRVFIDQLSILLASQEGLCSMEFSSGLVSVHFHSILIMGDAGTVFCDYT
jgi:hypothetical protein